MIIGEYQLKCPNCSTEVKVVAEMVSPVIIYCHGCSRSMILSNNVIFTVPFEFIAELASKHNIRSCGNVLGTAISPVAKNMINLEKIDQLHHMLEQPLDVTDFLKKL